MKSNTVIQIQGVRQPAKYKVELLGPQDAPRIVVELAKLFFKSQEERPWHYPSIREENDKDMVHHLYRYMADPGFVGAWIKAGKKTVGYVLGQIQERPFGKPNHFLQILDIYFDPSLRGQGLVWQTKKALFKQARTLNVHHWEANRSLRRRGLARAERLGGAI